ncbi:uncharacterized protein LOC112011059 [Quercus suber]|uniref:uncharacterized protein LOC112011059 n=1 Tax=Quercus suber TaxID=58331 RepID=UPI000CE1D7D5|nr:uncharacterized protein LOC112011059 [Quercus suber]
MCIEEQRTVAKPVEGLEEVLLDDSKPERMAKIGTLASPLVCQKKQVMVKKEADFIREVYYLDWLANVMMVKKANEKWRMCVDFTDLNRACPKDNYPLPRIDILVDLTVRHQLLSFMDMFSGYSQIKLDEANQEKIHSSPSSVFSATK